MGGGLQQLMTAFKATEGKEMKNTNGSNLFKKSGY